MYLILKRHKQRLTPVQQKTKIHWERYSYYYTMTSKIFTLKLFVLQSDKCKYVNMEKAMGL